MMPKQHWRLAKQFLKFGNNEEAEKYLSQIIEKHPDNLQARLVDAERLISIKEFEEAISRLDKLLIDIPASFADANYSKAIAHLALRQPDSAKQILGQILEARADHGKSQKLLSKLYLNTREYQKAVDLGESILARDANNTEALKTVGAGAILLDQSEKARQIFEKLIKVNPGAPEGYQALGLLYIKLKDPVKAIENFEKVLEISPGRLDAVQKLVLIQLAKKDPDQALKVCDNHLAKVGDNPNASAGIHLLKGQVYLAKNEFDNAQHEFDTAIKITPDQQEGYFFLAKLFITRFGEEKAIEEMEKKIAEDPEQPISHLLIANMYDLGGRYDKSEGHYRKVMELRPNYIPATNNLAYVLAEQGKDLEDALKYAKLAREKLGDNVQVLDTLGWIQTKMGNTDEAIINFQKSLEQAEGHPSILYHLGIAYLKSGDKDKARVELEKALASNQDFPEKDKVQKALSDL